ncbi:MAG: DNA mismatch repair protein MutS, partial [Bradyrhizobiaceae bacterium]|nr:DNA mismatch repair protein MutS [Bradyrhizobiaceae bacterium]
MDASLPSGASADAPASPTGDEGRVTPLMEQYIEIKAANPGCLLFYRMGDFYELFFEDAEVASRALGIVLTKRGKHRGRDIPMCGVPIHRSDEYLHRLIAQGYRVAVCEQTEDPAEAKKRGAKSVVQRAVIRLVTAGTLTEDSLLDARRNNYLLAVAWAKGKRPASTDGAFALAWLDISTGEFRVASCDRNGLPAEIARLEPGEIIVSDALYEDAALAPLWRSLPAVTPLARDVFDGASADRRLAGYFGVATVDVFGALSPLELAAAAACVTYVERTQIGKRPPLSPPAREASDASLAIDAATRANLELMRNRNGERRGSLIAAIDRTVTVAGARMLAQRLAAPLTDPVAINRRLDAIELFVSEGDLRAEVRARLQTAPDLARALARL